jgi:hypothetical protein
MLQYATPPASHLLILLTHWLLLVLLTHWLLLVLWTHWLLLVLLTHWLLLILWTHWLLLILWTHWLLLILWTHWLLLVLWTHWLLLILWTHWLCLLQTTLAALEDTVQPLTLKQLQTLKSICNEHSSQLAKHLANYTLEVTQLSGEFRGGTATGCLTVAECSVCAECQCVC